MFVQNTPRRRMKKEDWKPIGVILAILVVLGLLILGSSKLYYERNHPPQVVINKDSIAKAQLAQRKARAAQRRRAHEAQAEKFRSVLDSLSKDSAEARRLVFLATGIDRDKKDTVFLAAPAAPAPSPAKPKHVAIRRSLAPRFITDSDCGCKLRRAAPASPANGRVVVVYP